MASRYLTWTVPQLKRELLHRDAVTHGRKTELIQRLESYDRNKNFLPPPIIIPDPLEVDWPSSGYQQLNPNHRKMLPHVTRDQTEAYFLHRLAGDNESARNIKAIKNGELLFDSKRILACSVLIEKDIFFTGIVSAAMKNKVTYNFKLRMEMQSGDILSSHCECPAGKGPNGACKHLAAVMVMLENFIEFGELSIEKSCTENLMMFNKPKSSHKGSPVKVENLSRKRANHYMLDDPRPVKMRNMAGFEDRVLNILVNYTSQTSADIAYRYLFKKADLKSAVNDHDYLPLPFTEYWVDQSLKIKDTSDRDKIEIATRGQSSNKRWFAERTWRLTASRFGQITHMTDKRNKQKLCETLFSSKQINSLSILHGKNYEKKSH